MPKIAFIENKPIDFERISDLLAESRSRNHFSNFGPVSIELEAMLAARLSLPREAGLDCMFCCSGTTSLNAAAGALSTLRGKNLRWLVSANGFYSTRIGPFTGSVVVDCDRNGLLDLEAAAQVPDDAFDGIVYTNMFGYFDDFAPVFEFCRERGKALILDNAASLGTMSRFYGTPETAGVDWVEIFSFHQTKPWGLGEGGAAVFAAHLRDGFHAMVNFGIDLSQEVQVYAGNGKISEVACAMIATRLETMDVWGKTYRAQAARLIELGRSVGLSPLVDELRTNSVPGHVPFRSQKATTYDMLENDLVVMQKYYRPLDARCPQARRHFDHTFSVPCHGEMANLPDGAICELLARYA